MIYLLAIVFSLIASVQSFALEITRCNIIHLKNERQPNAGAAIFPTIPLFQIIAAGIAWLLEKFLQPYAIWIFSFLKLKAELNRI
jgi:energy-converting hydrogenase Eha subunit A